MKEGLILLAGVALCMIGALAGTTTMRPHPGLQKFAIRVGVSLMVVATIWAILDPATWAVR